MGRGCNVLHVAGDIDFEGFFLLAEFFHDHTPMFTAATDQFAAPIFLTEKSVKIYQGDSK
jgi:hypothetical protein